MPGFSKHQTPQHGASAWGSPVDGAATCLWSQVELSSESNLFFHYVHDMEAGAFKALQVQAKGLVKTGAGKRLVGFSDKPAPGLGWHRKQPFHPCMHGMEANAFRASKP